MLYPKWINIKTNTEMLLNQEKINVQLHVYLLSDYSVNEMFKENSKMN